MKRDYKAEYRWRIERLTALGASVPQARGHARSDKDEMPLRDLRALVTGLGDPVKKYRKMYTDLHEEMRVDGPSKLAGWANYFRSWGLEARRAHRLFWSPDLVARGRMFWSPDLVALVEKIEGGEWGEGEEP